jgi:acetoin:2,6-dichlorophenolindophenol oxidoreductase subunit beta
MPWVEALMRSQARNEVATTEGRALSYSDALNEALAIAMKMDPKVFVYGLGADDPIGVYGVSKGLQEKFGSDRVFDMPLSEEAMTGIGVGAAMSGYRPVLLHQRPDFLLLTFNQIVSHASKIHFMDNGATQVPMVIWSAIGRGWGCGAQHSQAIQGLLLSVPGLKIVMPSTAYDAKGLMLSAIADNNPVLFFDHRWSMRKKEAVPEGFYSIPFGKGIYRRQGKDLTIVGTSHALHLGMDAIDKLAAEKITADVIDLRTIKPLDEEIILESVAKTGKLLVLDTGWSMGGVCAEIGCLVAEKGFSSLKAPIKRIGLPDVPTPAGYTLEQYYYPDEKKIAAAIRELCA